MNENNVLIYQDENGITKVSVRFSDEDLWLTQQQIAELYDTTQQNISQHIDSIYKDGELDRGATNKKFLLVRTVERKGRVSHKQAIKKAEQEFEIYRAREMRQLESDFDRALKMLQQKKEDGQE
ncbi:hypothetical protein H8702_09895 [Massilimaliae timonensis]|uniref:Uncharacterized protein n=1 Tax=Massiliimalia timonensis TaxID=1987501 RepID=A0A8J6TRU6_9FIRM|nr:hypothetical protein [Massiliimalia timonensis]MBC8611411.1 hypothetical protein [Massiliimalia timonensis]